MVMRFPAIEQRQNMVSSHSLAMGLVWGFATVVLVMIFKLMVAPSTVSLPQAGLTVAVFCLLGSLWGHLTRNFILRSRPDAR
jgi:hypothetical protein